MNEPWSYLVVEVYFYTYWIGVSGWNQLDLTEVYKM